MIAKTEFICGGKCRICPYPGANCKDLTKPANVPEHCDTKALDNIDCELQEQFLKRMHVK